MVYGMLSRTVPPTYKLKDKALFYLTYRPKTISELDNRHVRDVLTNTLQSKNLPHAFLFVGTKGMGKTSSARIFAKSVNCLENKYAGKGESIEPCNNCSNCKSITIGTNADVLELDAASNRGIEEIKKIIHESVFAPMTGRYRVFIIDEAHMITHDAFNALLKTLEEPPETVMFILATTNEEKVPSTIISRCMKVQFGSAKAEDIKHQLQRIATAEKIELSPELASLIVRYCDRSFRDAAKLLEELFIQNKMTLEDAEQFLGIRAKDNLLIIMKEKDLKESLLWIDQFTSQGGNVKNLLEDLLQRLREQLMVKNGLQSEETPDLGFSVKEISMLMKFFTEAYGNLRISPIQSIPLEIAVTEFYNLKK